jgi:hypothetical protein
LQYGSHGRFLFVKTDNAHILEWNPSKNEYCKFQIWIGGDYRSPEQERGEPIDEKSDVWPMGANIFVLLSGLMPYYDTWDTKDIEEIIASGERPYLDPRFKDKSYIESRMYEIMELCFEVDSVRRVDIFTVVQHLRETREVYLAELRRNGELAPDEEYNVLRPLAKRIQKEDEEAWLQRLAEKLRAAELGLVEEYKKSAEEEESSDSESEDPETVDLYNASAHLDNGDYKEIILAKDSTGNSQTDDENYDEFKEGLRSDKEKTNSPANTRVTVVAYLDDEPEI